MRHFDTTSLLAHLREIDDTSARCGLRWDDARARGPHIAGDTDAEWQADRLLDVVIDTMIDGLIVVDMEGRIRRYNGGCERIFGYASSEIVGGPMGLLLPEASDCGVASFFQRCGETGRRLDGTTCELTARHKNGEPLPISIAVNEARLADEAVFVGVVRDLRATKTVEANLRQAQRLDSIGQLTGGIAHDFNNILMVIMATAEGLSEDLGACPQAAAIDQIVGAAQRAADLTARLLAFARKQPLKPQISDVNELVGSIGKMLARTLGEHILIDYDRDPELWRSSVDRAQFEAGVINLCINARDAMPDGGRLKIETRNVTLDKRHLDRHADVTPGDYVMVAVTDTGTGIAEEQLDRVFEPFFTTKEVGKGTGLGLSMVYGFVKQSEGHVEISSQLGHGTSVRLYLPATRGPRNIEFDRPAGPPTGTERILVVEDDDGVRETVVNQLRSLGYHVGSATGGDGALVRMREDPPYQLLLTDVMMPGPFNGKTLAEAARLRQPGLRVMFMSGYAQSVMVTNGKLDAGVHLLNKPFRKRDLACAVRTMLDAA